ncbi:calcium-binding protein, partial [Paracoccus siganidrum]
AGVAPPADDKPADPKPKEDDDDGDPPPEGGNRPPRVSGPVQLADMASCAVLAIGLAQLLRHAEDPDGDALSVHHVTASAGTVIRTDSGWDYRPDPGYSGPVTLSYEIGDGQASITQTAHFTVFERHFIQGTDGDDNLLGGACAEDIDGGDGDDNIDAGGGADVVRGGRGNDHIIAGDGNDTVFGGDGDDVIFGGRGDDHLWGGAGDDRIFGQEGDDIIHGEAGDDLLDGGAGDDYLDGGTGNDSLYGRAGDDVLIGGDGDDLLEGGAGNDVLSDGLGSDVVRGGRGDDHVIAALDAADDVYDGGAGVDTLDYSAATDSLTIDLQDGLASGEEIGTDAITGFENVIAGAGDDHVIAALDGGDSSLDGGEGVDTLDYSAATDSLVIDLQDGFASGEEIGTDAITGFENVIAGAGDDHVIAALDGGDSSLDGGEGMDKLDYSAAEDCLLIDLDAGIVSGVEIGTDSITGFEAVSGGQGDDHFILGDDPFCLEGGGGDNLFEFLAPTVPSDPEAATATRSFEITDFKVGDRLRMSKYDLFERIIDRHEDEFEKIYGEDFDDDDIRIRFRHESDDSIDRTVIEADFNRDDIYETTITLEGRHLLVIVEHGLA